MIRNRWFMLVMVLALAKISISYDGPDGSSILEQVYDSLVSRYATAPSVPSTEIDPTPRGVGHLSEEGCAS
jgi:hypothetical protein